MGACVAISGPPASVSIQLPGGMTLKSMGPGTQQIQNSMDPFQSLLQLSMPAFGAMQPVFDIIKFVMKVMECTMTFMSILGGLLGVVAPGNMISSMFPVPGIKVPGSDDEEMVPYVPDFSAIIPKMLDCFGALFAAALKLAGLIPQLSAVMTVKDGVMTAIGLADAAMAQVNELADLFTGLPPPNTGNLKFDAILQCAGDNAQIQLQHKLGPVTNLIPIMAVLSMLLSLAASPLPRVIYDMTKMVAMPVDQGGFGIIPFADLSSVGGPTPDEQRQQLLATIEDMTISGLPISIPDFSDLSSIGPKLRDLQAQMQPILPVIEMIMGIFNSLAKG